MNIKQLKEDLKVHEGIESLVYTDTRGIPTIGVGRNLRDVGLSEDEIEFLLENDIKRVVKQCEATFKFFKKMSKKQKAAWVNFVFNVGIGTAQRFTRAISYGNEGKWLEMADEMLDSRWKKQVGQRAYDVTDAIRGG